MAKYIIVLSLDFNTPDDVANAVKKIDPPNIHGFTGKVRIAVDPVASQVEHWLDEEL